MTAQIPSFGAGFEQAMVAFDLADDAYNFIADTPIKELNAKAEEAGAMVTKARDAWKKAKSFNLGKIELGQDPFVMEDVRYSKNSDVIVPINGHKVKFQIRILHEGFGVDGHGVRCYITVVTSRERKITTVNAYTSFESNVADGAFAAVLASDTVSIPSLAEKIKR